MKIQLASPELKISEPRHLLNTQPRAKLKFFIREFNFFTPSLKKHHTHTHTERVRSTYRKMPVP